MRFAALALAGLLVTTPTIAQDIDIPESGFVVSDDTSLLPQSVQDKRLALIAAAETGDVAELEAIFDAEASPPTVSFGDPDDAIAYLKGESADGEGYEILALLADILSAPYAEVDGGDGKPFYVWPYLAQYEDLTDLTPAEKVDGIRIAGYDDFTVQEEIGSWYFWRVFIGAEGQLQAFVAGD
jgi:hypothetical protein